MTQLYRISSVRAAAMSSAILVAACATYPAPSASIPAPASNPALASNPLLVESTLPYHAPRFDLIRTAHYQPAIEEGMRQQLVEINAIAKQMQQPTFDNTIVAMERSGALLTRAAKVFFAVVGANTNDTLQKVNDIVSPKLAAHGDAIFLNDQLYNRVKSLYDGRESSNLARGAEGVDRALQSGFRPRRRAAQRKRQDQDAGDQPGAVEARHGVHQQAVGGNQSRRARRRRSFAARRPERRRDPDGRRCGQGARAHREMVDSASQHHAAAGAGIAEESCNSPAPVRAVDAANIPRRQQRHPEHDSSPGRAPRAEGAAAWLPDVGGVRARRRRREEPRERDQAADRYRRSGHGESAPRNRGHAEAHRRAGRRGRRVQAPALGLPVLRRAGEEGEVRSR